MATYFYRDGREHKTEFALPVNYRGEYRRQGHATLYTEARLQQLRENEWLREHGRLMTTADRVIQAKREREELYGRNAETLALIEELKERSETLLNLWEKLVHGLPLDEQDFKQAARAIKEVMR